MSFVGRSTLNLLTIHVFAKPLDRNSFIVWEIVIDRRYFIVWKSNINRRTTAGRPF